MGACVVSSFFWNKLPVASLMIVKRAAALSDKNFLSLGYDLLRFLMMLDCMGRYELSDLRLTCKVILEIGALVYDEDLCVWLVFDGTTVFRPASNSNKHRCTRERLQQTRSEKDTVSCGHYSNRNLAP
jgi:hypothetical protein